MYTRGREGAREGSGRNQSKHKTKPDELPPSTRAQKKWQPAFEKGEPTKQKKTKPTKPTICLRKKKHTKVSVALNKTRRGHAGHERSRSRFQEDERLPGRCFRTNRCANVPHGDDFGTTNDTNWRKRQLRDTDLRIRSLAVPAGTDGAPGGIRGSQGQLATVSLSVNRLTVPSQITILLVAMTEREKKHDLCSCDTNRHLDVIVNSAVTKTATMIV